MKILYEDAVMLAAVKPQGSLRRRIKQEIWICFPPWRNIPDSRLGFCIA